MTLTRRLMVLAAASSLALAACGDDDDNGGGGETDTGIDATDAGGGDTGGDDTGTDAGGEDTGGEDTGGEDTGGEDTGGEDTGGEDTGGEDAGDTTAPEITGITITQNPNNVLSAFVEVTTDEVADLVMTVTDPDGEVVFEAMAEDTDTFEFFAMGMVAETEHTVTIAATDAAGNEGQDSDTYTSGALPDDLPPFEVTVTDADAMNGEYTLFNTFQWGDAGPNGEYGFLGIVNAEGDLVWYYRTTEERCDEHRVTDDGRIIYVANDTYMVEIDWTGEELGRVSGVDMGIESIHHEVYPLENGNWLTLGSEWREIEGFTNPDDPEGDTISRNVVADRLVEFNFATGEVVNEITLFDVWDPLTEVTGLSTNGFWNNHYAEYFELEATADWTHGNAIVWDAENESVIVSLRHMNTLLNISWPDGEIVWEYGPFGDVALAEGTQYLYGSHAPEIGEDGEILFFDNGNQRPSETFYSRLVKFTITDIDGTLTATETWEYRPEGAIAPFLGDADDLGTTVLGNFGGSVGRLGNFALPDIKKFGWIVEVTDTEDPQIVWELFVGDRADEDFSSWSVYRAQRLDHLGMPMMMDSGDE